MAAYRRVDGLKSPKADCLYTGISNKYERIFTFFYDDHMRIHRPMTNISMQIAAEYQVTHS